ncbi:MAG TPA: ATP-binding protein [Phycisphaerales bacterium]|nr:ATP-binding protein [Phycisphaerales bacterium]
MVNGTTGGPVERDVHNDRAEIEAVEQDLLGLAERAGYSKASRFAIRLAFEEAITNAFQHGHRGLDESVPVRVGYEVGPEEVRIWVEDKGKGFRVEDVPDPTLDENLTNPSGRGLMLMRSYMTSVRYNPTGNRVEMVYRRR